MVEFATRLRQLRKDKHLTQAQVASRIGVTPSMVSSYETDIRLPSYDVMIRIADVFGVTVDYLLCRQEKRFVDISDLTEPASRAEIAAYLTRLYQSGIVK